MPRQGTWNPDFYKGLEETANSPLNPIKYLACDPGKYNGFCGYDAKYYLQFMYVVEEEHVVSFLKAFSTVDKCIIEDYRLFPNKAQKQFYSDMVAPRVIGRVEGWAETRNVELIKQAPSVKETGYKWIGRRPPSKSSNNNDPMDAHVHFMYWGIKNGKIDARKLLDLSKAES